MNILLVEDHLGLAAMTCGVLQDIYGHEVRHVATGTEAIEEYLQMRPELVIIDIHLPDMDGYQLARRLRQQPCCEVTVLVAVTGFGNIVDDESAHAAGFDAHFRKPMDFDLLPSLRRRTSHPA